MTPTDVVNAFIAAVEARDLDAAVRLMADDVVYDNVPMPTINGTAGVREFLGPFIESSSKVEFEVLRQLADGNTVMNERIDRFFMEAMTVEIPVVGVWEVQGDKIVLWRDYFDMSMATGGGGASEASPS
jgi:limonene-1,2-epoxide hydrolase